MISNYHRNIAMEVAAGTCGPLPDDKEHNKAANSGLVARTMSQVTLPTVDEVLGNRNAPGYVEDVARYVGEELLSRSEIVLDNNPALEEELGESIARLASSRDRKVRTPAYILQAGINTGRHFNVATLSTIQWRTMNGEEITEEGLMKSQRTTFAFAMGALADLNIDHSGIFDWVKMPEVVAKPRFIPFSRSVKVLKPELVAMSRTKGLSFVDEMPPREYETPFDGEPVIGCPITMIKHYIRDLHAVTAEACVQAGIIQVTKS